MIYFCADDYGISKSYNECIEACLKNGILNKVSVLPNGEVDGFVQKLACRDALLTLHLNLVEGYPISKPEEVSLLIDESGCFKRSFIGLFLASYSLKRKEFQKQIYTEIKNQITHWINISGSDKISIDSHQHAYLIPPVFKTLMQVIRDEGINIEYMRVASEPLLPYILTPSLYTAYKPSGLIKQWLLNFLALINRREIRKAGIKSAYFMGVVLSGHLNAERVSKLLTRYKKLADKHGKNIEIGFHPGCAEHSETLMRGSRQDFNKFYSSPWRTVEFETLMNNDLYKLWKEG